MSTPNILILLVDQLRRSALGSHGDPHNCTPNIDALAASGTAFQNACTTYPICVPFRFTLMTGEYAHSRLIPGIEYRMSPTERTLADEFNDAGYDTWYIGKWHLYGGHGRGRKSLPSDVRVPRTFQGRWKNWRAYEIHNDAYNWSYYIDDAQKPIIPPTGTHQTDGLFDLAIESLSNRPDKESPFAMVLSVEAPHLPMEATPEYAARWANREMLLPANFEAPPEEREEWIQDRRNYYALLEHLDDNVGRLMTYLRDNKLTENTIIMLFADHGELSGSHGTTIIDFLKPRIENPTFWSVRQKQFPYEESVGIPLIVVDPTCPASRGRRPMDPTCTEDLFPTILGLAGITPRNTVPGMDLSPVVRGKADSLPREGVMLEFVLDFRVAQAFYDRYWRAFRTERYKYVTLGDFSGAAPWLFFDMQNDPCELHNLVDDPAMREEVARHHRLLRDRLVETEDHFYLRPAFDCPGLPC